MKRYSISLMIREMHINTTLRYHLTPARMGVIKKPINNKSQRWGREKGTCLHCWWKCKLVKPLWTTNCFPNFQTISSKTSKYNYHVIQQSHSQVSIQRKPRLQKNTCNTMFIAALCTIAKTWKQPQCPSTEEWITKVWYIYIPWNITQTQKRMK